MSAPESQDACFNCRVDRWLWAVRAFKTRSAAAKACRLGQVKVGGQRVKPSRGIRVGDAVEVTRGELVRSLKVVGILENRVGAARVSEFCEDLTDPVLYQEAARISRERRANRMPGPSPQGRPSRREREAMRKFLEG